jgi:hypothetical protein
MTTRQRKRQQSQTGRAGALPAHVTESADADDDELTLSLIETFPASDPPAWIIPLARVGTPKRRTKSHTKRSR